MLETIVEEALRQADELLELDAPRADVWARDPGARREGRRFGPAILPRALDRAWGGPAAVLPRSS